MSAITVGGFTSYSSRPVAASPKSKLRMTKRGRAVLLTLISTPLVIAALAFGLNSGAATGTSTSTPLSKITVVGGETLWGVANQVAPKADPRDVIAAIESVNQLTSPDIRPGQQLSIPAQYSH
jgi:LysM repeat protein